LSKAQITEQFKSAFGFSLWASQDYPEPGFLGNKKGVS
jgi:hypothetical protein